MLYNSFIGLLINKFNQRTNNYKYLFLRMASSICKDIDELSDLILKKERSSQGRFIIQ